MFGINDDARGDVRRAEVLTGAAERRCWSAEERAVIVAESEAAGMRVSDVARRWRLRPQQLYQWRHLARAEAASELKAGAMPDFVPIVTAPARAPEPASRSARLSWSVPVIEIKLAGAVVRVGAGLDDAQLTAVLRAVRASASQS
jgi:transposase